MNNSWFFWLFLPLTHSVAQLCIECQPRARGRNGRPADKPAVFRRGSLVRDGIKVLPESGFLPTSQVKVTLLPALYAFQNCSMWFCFAERQSPLKSPHVYVMASDDAAEPLLPSTALQTYVSGESSWRCFCPWPAPRSSPVRTSWAPCGYHLP